MKIMESQEDWQQKASKEDSARMIFTIVFFKRIELSMLRIGSVSVFNISQFYTDFPPCDPISPFGPELIK